MGNSPQKRIPFRTTIDETLLQRLKQYAVDKGVNANDVLEVLLRDKLIYGDESAFMADTFWPLTDEQKKQFVRFRVGEAIEDSLLRLGFKPTNLKVQSFCLALGAAVADLVVGQEDWWNIVKEK